jgi:ppGpp synthetase/RelA/SpoT-type nucleotidyltranferase
MVIDYTKASCIFDRTTNDILSDEMVKIIQSLLAAENMYVSATREIATKLENLDDEFKVTLDRNPIQQIKTRVKH